MLCMCIQHNTAEPKEQSTRDDVYHPPSIKGSKKNEDTLYSWLPSLAPSPPAPSQCPKPITQRVKSHPAPRHAMLCFPNIQPPPGISMAESEVLYMTTELNQLSIYPLAMQMPKKAKYMRG